MNYQLGPAQPEDLEEILDVESQVFAPDLHRGFLTNLIARSPRFRADGLLCAKDESGHVVSVVAVFPRLVRYGAAKILCGGVVGVATLPAHRRRGLATRLLRLALKYMRQAGMVVSVLGTTTPDFYRRLGWEAARPHYLFRLRTRTLSQVAAKGYVIRGLTGEDLKALVELEAVNRPYPFSPIRTVDEWRCELTNPCKARSDQREDPAGSLIAVEAGRPLAYLRSAFTSRAVRVMDAGGLDLRAHRALLARLGKIAGERGCHSLDLILPGSHPAVRAAKLLGVQELGGLEAPGLSARMLRITTLAGFIQAAHEELADKARTGGCVELKTEEEAVTLKVCPDHIELTTRPAGDFFHTTSQGLAYLVAGTRGAAQLAAAGLASGTPGAVKLVGSLFPHREPWPRTIDPLCQ